MIIKLDRKQLLEYIKWWAQVVCLEHYEDPRPQWLKDLNNAWYTDENAVQLAPITGIVGNSVYDNIRDDVVRTLHGEPVGILFLDSDHDRVHVLHEYQLYSPLVESGGLILIDDINPGDTSAWDAIDQPHKFHSTKLHGSSGFGIIVKR